VHRVRRLPASANRQRQELPGLFVLQPLRGHPRTVHGCLRHAWGAVASGQCRDDLDRAPRGGGASRSPVRLWR
jgi:hypothetical protein